MRSTLAAMALLSALACRAADVGICDHDFQLDCDAVDLTPRILHAVVPAGAPGAPERDGVIFRFEPLPSGAPAAWVRFPDGVVWQVPLAEIKRLYSTKI